MKSIVFFLAIAAAATSSVVAQSPPTNQAAKPKPVISKPELANQRRPDRRPSFARRIVRSGRAYVCYYYVQPPYYQYYCQPTGRHAGSVFPIRYRYNYNTRGGGSYYRQVGPYYWYYYWR